MIIEDICKANMEALKNHDKIARSILTLVYGKLKLASIDKGLGGKELPDGDSLNIINKTIKELDDEMNAYKTAGRDEQAAEIASQKDVLVKYLPKMMTEEEIKAEIMKLEDKSIPAVMKYFKANHNGTCDMGLVSKIVKSL